MTDVFQSICAQVQSFGDDIRGISAVYPGFTFSIKEIADEQRILLTATAALSDSFDSKSATIANNGSKWTIDGLYITDTYKVKSLYLPFVFKRFQLGVLNILEQIPKIEEQLHMLTAVFESPYLLVRGLEYTNALVIRLSNVDDTEFIYINVNRNEQMDTDQIRGLLKIHDNPGFTFTSVSELMHKLELFVVQERQLITGSAPVWMALDKLAMIMTHIIRI